MKLGGFAGLLSAAFGVAAANATTPSLPEPAVAEPIVEAAAPAPAVQLVPANTVVMIAVDTNLTSKTAAKGTMFPLHLAEPVIVEGKTILPAGLTGEGEIIHVAKAGFGGKAGEMILAARYLNCGATRIPLGRFKLGTFGDSAVEAAMAATLVVPVAGFFIDGGEVHVPNGARATARTKAEVQLSADAGGDCQASMTSTTSNSNGG